MEGQISDLKRQLDDGIDFSSFTITFIPNLEVMLKKEYVNHDVKAIIVL